MLGEPINWEGALQIIIDVLMTNGDPRADISSPDKFSTIPYPHIPIIACNKDLTFKGAAHLPRFGHGAFLDCLESLYERITNHELRYEVLIGKPYMSTYKFAIQALEKLNNNNQIKKVFIIGDNPDVDVKGANLFNFYSKTNKKKDKRQIDVESILVCTGVYNPSKKLNDELEQLEIDKLLKLSVELDEKSLKNLFSHKRSKHDNMLSKPNVILNDILDAVHHIVKSH
jgi:HAD superfamily hydrolase (TIGR01456 family)